MSDVAAASGSEAEPEIRARSAEPRPFWLWPLLPIGIASIFVGTMVLNDVTAEIRVTLVLVGIVGWYYGLDSLCQKPLGFELRHLGVDFGVLAVADWAVGDHGGVASAE